MARLASVSYPLPDPDTSPEQHQAAFETLVRRHHERGDRLVGALLALDHPQGKAWYLVTKASPLTLQYVPYSESRELPESMVIDLRRNDIERSVLLP